MYYPQRRVIVSFPSLRGSANSYADVPDLSLLGGLKDLRLWDSGVV